MITIPTTELIGGLNDVLPIISDPKAELAGVRIAWDGEKLHFTTYHVNSGATVSWWPGEGAEGDFDTDEDVEEINWGGDDAPWATWIRIEQAKEILKLFKLPAKLWRFPVTLKCSLSGDRLTIERTDSPKGERLLSIPGEPKMLREIPNVRTYCEDQDRTPTSVMGATFNAARLGAFGSVRPHGLMTLIFGQENDPVEVKIGTRFAGFVFPATAKSVPRFNLLRDGAGLVTSPTAVTYPGEWPDGQDD